MASWGSSGCLRFCTRSGVPHLMWVFSPETHRSCTPSLILVSMTFKKKKIILFDLSTNFKCKSRICCNYISIVFQFYLCHTLGYCFYAKPNIQIKMNDTSISFLRVFNLTWHLASNPHLYFPLKGLRCGEGRKGAEELILEWGVGTRDSEWKSGRMLWKQYNQ